MRLSTLFGISAVLICFAGTARAEQNPYYQGQYPGQAPATSDNAPTDQQQEPPPPVVYRRAPYRRVYQAPAYAAPNAAALAPWPWNFDFGGGPTIVTGSNHDFNNGSNFTVGGGYNFNPRFGFALEFSNYWMGLSDEFLARNGADDGHADIWSITLEPIWRFRIGGPVGGYLIGGGGYYQRDESIFVPVTFFDPFFGFVAGEQEYRQSDDAGGVNAGAGLTFNMGWGTKFFMEARYHHIFTPGGATRIIPITFGVRW